ncbi:GNAT family N-acetyltransferase [Stenotrophomonas acidaminiphila]|uniref:GNAT family N-acetyltransferase n=1 Tax=Stenotrophomonas acidaminiphila TaxID=128780 RepID=UPI0020C64441|nr:GNAT family N-acetyltransferase [Stenotrophomonas acidaminiphila]
MTVEFLATKGGKEAGLLIFHHWPFNSIGIIHEIYVLHAFRGRGVGTKLLAFAERYVVDHKCRSLQLTARSLDSDFMSNSNLRKWYSSHGFMGADSGGPTMKKVLLTDPAAESFSLT